jgi:hypothetical protein
MNGFLEPELAEFEWSMEHSIANRCQTRVKLNSVTCLYIKKKKKYIYIWLHVAAGAATCPSSPLRHAWLWRNWNTGELYSKLCTIFIWFLSIMKVHCTELYCILMNNRNMHYTVLDTSVTDSRLNLTGWLRWCNVLYTCRHTGNLSVTQLLWIPPHTVDSF